MQRKARHRDPHTEKRSALLVAKEVDGYPEINLRIDDHDDPVGELQRLWQVWAPEVALYVQRVLDPDSIQ